MREPRTAKPSAKLPGAVPARMGLVLLGSLIGVIAAAFWRLPPSPPPLPPDVHRASLEYRDGRWFLPKQDKGFTGFLLETYENGGRKSRSAVFNGFLEGLSEGWHTNGNLQVQEPFRAGVSHGLRTRWYANGVRCSEAMIIEGELHGPFRRWLEDGSLCERIEMDHGQPSGLSVAYYSSGFVRAEAWLKSGKLSPTEVLEGRRTRGRRFVWRILCRSLIGRFPWKPQPSSFAA